MSKRCHICIGCGRCVADNAEIHVLTEYGSGLDKAAAKVAALLKCIKGRRLVTVDIGTTTIAMQLHDEMGVVCDTYAVVNPQTEYGADVLSRIQAAENKAIAEEMQRQVQKVLAQGFMRFQTKLQVGEHLQAVIAANTTMVYLLMGWDTAELGKAPFCATHLEVAEIVIEDVPCYIVPGLSAFVGGDIIAGILASGMAERDEVTLLIDLGTNGEMVLGNRQKLLACSTAAGPAFEGGVNRGVWGADMIRILAKLREENLVDETGLLADPYFEEGVRIGDVCVTQEAIRAIQLAKGAVAAGIQIMMQEYGITFGQIDRVVLSGGFGYRLQPNAAAEIGLLPKALVEKTVPGGNTALQGAVRVGGLVLSGVVSEADKLTTHIKEMTKLLSLAEHPDFGEIYLSSMNLTETDEMGK